MRQYYKSSTIEKEAMGDDETNDSRLLSLQKCQNNSGPLSQGGSRVFIDWTHVALIQ